MNDKSNGYGIPGLIMILVNVIGSLTLNDVATMVGIISGLMGVAYYLFKIKKEFFNNEKNNH